MLTSESKSVPPSRRPAEELYGRIQVYTVPVYVLHTVSCRSCIAVSIYEVIKNRFVEKTYSTDGGVVVV